MIDVMAWLAGSIFVTTAVICALITYYGIKERSYEEALAQQRRQQQLQHEANSFLGQHGKAKETKKQKKKKVKEKQPPQSQAEKETAEDSENTESNSVDTATPEHHGHGKHHVEFKEPSAIAMETAKEVKDASANNSQLKLKQNISKQKEEPVKSEPIKEVQVKELREKEGPTKEPLPKDKGKGAIKKDKNVKVQNNPSMEPPISTSAVEAPEVEVVPITATTTASAPQQQLSNTSGANNGTKEKKKKKGDANSLQFIVGGDKQGIVNLQTLMTLVRKAELSRPEVQNLIEVLLNKQHEAPAVIDEWTEGKADPIQKLKKQLADKERALADEHEALAGAQTKLREIRAEQTAERNQFQARIRGLEETLQVKMMDFQGLKSREMTQNQKIMHLTTQLNEEAAKFRQLYEENGVMQMKLAQTQEMEIAHLQLEKDFHNLQEMHGKLLHSQGFIKKEIDNKEDYIQQLQGQMNEMDHRIKSTHNQENSLKAEISQLKTVCQKHLEEIRRLELGLTQSVDDQRTIQKQKEESDKIIAQLKIDLQKSEEERLKLEDSKQNGSVEENKAHKIEILNLHNELSSVKMQLQQTETKYKVELEQKVSNLKQEIEEQKTKNNDEITKVQKQQQELNKRFIERLFPDIKVSENLSQEEWNANFEKEVVKYMQKLKQVKTGEGDEVSKLKKEIAMYKSAIEESEGILKKLEEHVEREELNWRSKLSGKETEIEILRNQQLETQVELRNQLEREKETRLQLSEQHEVLKNQSASTIEELTEQVARVQEELEDEKRKNNELIKTQQDAQNMPKAQNHTTNGTSLSAENSHKETT